jgi:hypothetical protein
VIGRLVTRGMYLKQKLGTNKCARWRWMLYGHATLPFLTRSAAGLSDGYLWDPNLNTRTANDNRRIAPDTTSISAGLMFGTYDFDQHARESSNCNIDQIADRKSCRFEIDTNHGSNFEIDEQSNFEIDEQEENVCEGRATLGCHSKDPLSSTLRPRGGNVCGPADEMRGESASPAGPASSFGRFSSSRKPPLPRGIRFLDIFDGPRVAQRGRLSGRPVSSLSLAHFRFESTAL